VHSESPKEETVNALSLRQSLRVVHHDEPLAPREYVETIPWDTATLCPQCSLVRADPRSACPHCAGEGGIVLSAAAAVNAKERAEMRAMIENANERARTAEEKAATALMLLRL
jgi:hypothetical protein